MFDVSCLLGIERCGPTLSEQGLLYVPLAPPQQPCLLGSRSLNFEWHPSGTLLAS